MRCIFELSGENPTLPLSELGCVGEVIDHRDQVAVAECANPALTGRLAMTHAVLEYLGECVPEYSAFSALLSDLALREERPFAGRVKKIHSGDSRYVAQCSQQDFERLIGTKIEGSVNLVHPETEFRAILSGDRCYFGRMIAKIDRRAYNSRNPGKRPFFHPGVMMPRTARAIVNLSRIQPKKRLLDPFCGTGGILIEADEIGSDAVGTDYNPLMILGCRKNIKSDSLLLADAASLPLIDSSFDAVVTDLPYGQSVSIRKEGSMEHLYGKSLGEIRRVLKTGCRAVVVTHRDISSIARDHMTIIEQHKQRVHKSLTRHILVLERG